jgi:GNAT superfamily N-acetyltransferase
MGMMPHMEWVKDQYKVSDDPSLLDIKAIHGFLETSYWAKGRTFQTVADSISASFILGLYLGDKQIGFSRAITDFVTFSYLCDVYVLEEHRGNRLGHFLLECLFSHPRFKNVRWILKTTYSQSLYRDFGFTDFESTTSWMVRKPGL